MKARDFFLKLDELLELEPGTIKGGETLESLEGWNSLAVISFIAMMDEMHEGSVTPKQLAACKTVSDLEALLPVVQ